MDLGLKDGAQRCEWKHFWLMLAFGFACVLCGPSHMHTFPPAGRTLPWPLAPLNHFQLGWLVMPEILPEGNTTRSLLVYSVLFNIDLFLFYSALFLSIVCCSGLYCCFWFYSVLFSFVVFNFIQLFYTILLFPFLFHLIQLHSIRFYSILCNHFLSLFWSFIFFCALLYLLCSSPLLNINTAFVIHS